MALLPVAAALLMTAPAPDAVTPEGPATLRATFLGPIPAVMFGPRVIVRWRVQVGEGGRAGAVALRVLRRDPNAPATEAFGRGATEELPAAPGVYEFPARLRISDGQELGLDQQAGGHAIATTGDHPEYAIDVWRPALGERETRGGFERIPRTRLLIAATFEPDPDRDGYGDTTQDENDLAIAGARPSRRSVVVRVRNRGKRTVHRPRLLVRVRGARLLTRTRWAPERPVPRGSGYLGLRPIAPGAVRSVRLRVSRPGFRMTVAADPEGFDRTPSRVTVRGR